MPNYPSIIERLIKQLCKFPGIGRRSAERMVSYIMAASKEEVDSLSRVISQTKEKIRFCRNCNNLSEADLCWICEDNRRDKSIICIVEQTNDVVAIEKTGDFHGLYYVLLGSIAPLEGKGPDDLKIGQLLARLKHDNIEEVIIATDSDTEGEMTALYLSKTIKPLGIKVSRIGLGLPFGSNLEYADATTLSKALESRREV